MKETTLQILDHVMDTIIDLRSAEEQGYGKRSTLQKAILSGRLKARKKGRDWITTTVWLEEAGYTPHR